MLKKTNRFTLWNIKKTERKYGNYQVDEANDKGHKGKDSNDKTKGSVTQTPSLRFSNVLVQVLSSTVRLYGITIEGDHFDFLLNSKSRVLEIGA